MRCLTKLNKTKESQRKWLLTTAKCVHGLSGGACSFVVVLSMVSLPASCTTTHKGFKKAFSRSLKSVWESIYGFLCLWSVSTVHFFYQLLWAQSPSKFTMLPMDIVAVDPVEVVFFPTDYIVPEVHSSTSDWAVEVFMSLWFTEWILKLLQAESCTYSIHGPSPVAWMNVWQGKRPWQDAGIRDTMQRLSDLYHPFLFWRHPW